MSKNLLEQTLNILLRSRLQLGFQQQFCKIVVAISFVLLSVNSACAQTCNPNMRRSTPAARFTPQGDGTVLDTQTNLIWKRCLEGQTWNGLNNSCDDTASNYTWQEALNVPQGNWRVPNIKELSSIVEISCYEPASNLTIFPIIGSEYVWSSTPSANYMYSYYGVSAWMLNFNGGVQQEFFTGNGYRVRLVRSGQEL